MRSEIRVGVGALAFVLSACGGGGSRGGEGTLNQQGSNPGAGLPVVVNFQASDATVVYDAASAAITANADLGVTGSRIDAAGIGSTVSITTGANGYLSSVTLNILTPGAAFDQTYTSVMPLTGLTLNELATALEGVNNASNTANGFIAAQQAQAQTLSASAYGIWAANDGGGNGRIGVLAIGNETTPAAMPMTGTATYNGTTIGVGTSTTTAFALSGTAQIVANFATASVTTSFSNIVTQNLATNAVGAMSDLTGASVIAGNKYAGPLAGGGLAGQVSGTFYGPAAQETAGVWNVSGGGLTAIGSFGAR